MPRLTGTALLQAKASGGSTKSGGRKAGTFTPLFNLQKGETAYIKFLREDDLSEVFLHTWVRVPAKTAKGEERGYDWETFASRTRNEEFDADSSVLEDELDHWPIKKIAGIVMALDPVYDGKGKAIKNITGFTVAGNTVERDNQDSIFYPRWQLVFEAYKTFWANLIQIQNNYGLDTYPLQVTRTEADGYQFLVVQVPTDEIDWESYEDQVPTISEEIARLGSEERYEEYFGEGQERVENQHQIHRYLPEWIQKERQDKLGLSDEEIAEDNKGEGWSEPVEEPTPPKSPKRKSRAPSFDDIEKIADEKNANKAGATPY